MVYIGNVISNAAIYVDHSTLNSKSEWVSQLSCWLQFLPELKLDLQNTVNQDKLANFNTEKTQNLFQLITETGPVHLVKYG